MIHSPKPNQIEGIKYAEEHPYSIAAWSMGTGKSFLALHLHEKFKRRTVIVCPAYLVPTWRQEVIKHIGPHVMVTSVGKGSDIYEFWDTDIILISSSLAQKAEHIFEWCNMLIIDEGDELFSKMDSKRSQFIHRVIYENSIERVHILTGTPIKNRVMEYYSLMAICNYNPQLKKSKFLEKFPDEITFADYFSHRQQYTMEINGKWITVLKWVGAQRVDELKSYLKDIYFRVPPGFSHLEPIVFKDILVSDTPDLALLEEFNNFYDIEEHQGIRDSRKSEAAIKTVPFTVRYVKDLLPEIGCAVIFTDHRASCKAIAESFGVPGITGEMSVADRRKHELAFQGGEMNVIVATTRSFSRGKDLTRSNNLFVNDPPWVPGDLYQIYHRIDRANQTRNCTVHRILGSPQSQTIYQTLSDKQDVINKTT